MPEEPPKEAVKEVPKKKKKKKKEVEKPKSEESRSSQLKVPKQTKPPITKAKGKSETKKISTKEPQEKLNKKDHAKKKTEKIALWAEDVNQSITGNFKTRVSNKKVGPVKATSSNKETNSTKTAKKVTDIIEKKTSLGTIKKIPKIPKKSVDTSSNSDRKDDVKRVRKTSFNENPFSKKIENISNNAAQEKKQSVAEHQHPRNAAHPRDSSNSMEEVVHFDVEDMQEDENYKNEVQVLHSVPLIKTPPPLDDAGHQINMNFSQEQLEQHNVAFEQQIHQGQQHQHEANNINDDQAESMEVDDAVKFSHEIMKEVVGIFLVFHLDTMFLFFP